MLVLITYDVSTVDADGKRRLRQVAKRCVVHGQRVQNSVFECSLDAAQYKLLQAELRQLIDPEKDSLRFYNLGNHYESRIEHIGVKTSYAPEGRAARIARAKRKPPAFCREVRTGFRGLFGKITAFSAKLILKRTVLWYTFCAKPMILIDRIVTLRSRSPCGERGLKFAHPPKATHTPKGRSPCGERGLKLHPPSRRRRGCWSLPVRGAWIEIPSSRWKQSSPPSLPVRGAWIEMCTATLQRWTGKVAPRAGSVD